MDQCPRYCLSGAVCSGGARVEECIEVVDLLQLTVEKGACEDYTWSGLIVRSGDHVG